MKRDNQLWRTRVGIFNSNKLPLFTCLNTNPENYIKIYIKIHISKFSYFRKISICLVLLSYLPVYLNLASVYNYNLNISTPMIAPTLIIKLFFTVAYYAFNLNRMLLLESGDMETNPRPEKSSFIRFFHWS